jgi:hypothetical protein
MSYLGSWKIDDYLTFCCNTHDPDTGVATDADAVPTYRVYEDETSTPIVTGSMALLDDGNTAGFYSERIQLSAANGFEKGKSYTIYVTATVDSDTGTMHHSFQIEAEVDCNTASDLHADLDDGGRLDLLIDGIKAKTDNLPADPADDSDIDGQLASIAADVSAILADTGSDGVVLADGAITAGKIGADAITAAKIAPDAITSSELASSAVTEIANGVQLAGAGAITWPITITQGGSPVPDCDVWVTTDEGGTEYVASGETNSAGVVTFYLDAGDYYVWCQKAGYNFSMPTKITVSE